MKKNDENIIKLLFDRDESALGIIEKLYGRLMKVIAYNLFRNESTADECVNDTLLAIWNTIPPEKPDSIIAYAGTIVRRKAIDRFRRDQTKKRYSHENPIYFEVYEELARMEDFSEDIIRKIEMKRIMNEFLSSLSANNREIFISRYFDLESLDSIASRMHITKNNLTVKLCRMRDKLSEILKKESML